MKPVFTLLLLFCALSSSFAQTRWYVRANASPVGADGSSWATATPFLQDAIDAAMFGDTIWISQGVYRPTIGTNRNWSFALKNGIRLFGGFTGTETQLEQRNWETNSTILSGDIGAPGDSTDNSYNILYATKTGLSTRIDGLILERANASNPDNINVFAHERGHSGSAIYLDGQGSGNFAYLTMANCTIRNNRSDHFGAVYANGRDNGKSTLRIENCRFEFNNAFSKGGALVVENYALQPEALRISGSVFQNNYGRIGGGSIYAEHHQEIVFENCQFDKNSVFAGSGGAVSLFGSNLSHAIRFEGCGFSENFTTGNLDGGAVSFYPINSVTSLQFSKCSFVRNLASEGGGVNILNGDSHCPVQFEQCQFIQNAADPGGVLSATMLSELGGLSFRHCLFYENLDYDLFLSGADNDDILLYNNIIVKFSGGRPFMSRDQQLTARFNLTNQPDCSFFGSAANCDTTVIFNGNPFFVDPPNGDFHLNPCSRAINAGSNALSSGITTDFDGRPRIMADIVDLGPYEHDLGFVPISIKPASCIDSKDGSIEFGGSNCAPVFIIWSMGGVFGTQTDSLAPGAYVFSFIDAAGHAAIDTVIVPTLPPLALTPNSAPPVCVGESNGVAGIDVSGGSSPIQINWENGGLGNYIFNLPAGMYPVTVTDALGCMASTIVEVPEAQPVEVFYTVIPATGPTEPDGAILIDSVLGCMGIYTWDGPQQTDLLPGSYTTTITDPCNCFALFMADVDFVVDVESTLEELFFRLSPNPVQAGQKAVLRWSDLPESVESVWIADASGRVIRQLPVGRGASQLEFPVPETAGLYGLVVRDGSRVLRVLKLVVR